MGWRLRFLSTIQPLEFVAVFEEGVVVTRHHQMDTFNIRRRERLLLPLRRHQNLVALEADVDVVVELIAFDV
jgi:hypothetical protein